MKCDPRILHLCVCFTLVTPFAGCSSPEPASAPVAVDAALPQVQAVEPEPTGLAELVPQGKEPWPGVLTGGQPSRDDFVALRDAGLKTVVNMRMPDERGTRDEPAWMEEIGLTYISIPVNGAEGLSADVARELDEVLQSSEQPMLVHCGSSNRVGAAFALRAFHLEGANADEAIELGIATGMTRLEGRVREMLAQ